MQPFLVVSSIHVQFQRCSFSARACGQHPCRYGRRKCAHQSRRQLDCSVRASGVQRHFLPAAICFGYFSWAFVFVVVGFKHSEYHNQELGNWESSVVIFEKIPNVANADLQSIVPKSWLRDINSQNFAYLHLLIAIRNAMASAAWSDVEVRSTLRSYC